MSSRSRNKATHITRTRTPGVEVAEYKLGTYTDQIGVFVCEQCKGEIFRVQSAMDGPLMQLFCASPRCGSRTKVLEMHKPEMTEGIAKHLGLWTPSMSRGPAIDMEIEVDN